MSEEYYSTPVKAVLRYLAVSPQKARLVVDQVRGKDAEEALDMLRFMPNRAAKPVYKLLRSAIANAEENYGLAAGDLYVSQIFVDGAPVRKWRRFGARGRFKPIVRRTSHITVILEEYEYE